MKIIDKIVSIIIIGYLIWISYYRLFCDENNLIHSQLYFLFESLLTVFLLLRLYINKFFSFHSKKVRNIYLVAGLFKCFCVLYTALSFSLLYEKYIQALESYIWSLLGVLIILTLLSIFGTNDLLRWVKKLRKTGN